MAKKGLNSRINAKQDIPTFEEIAQQVHIERIPTWKNAKHGQQWINTLRDYAFPNIGRMPIDNVDQPEVLMCLSPIWTGKHETAQRLAQRIKADLDVVKSKGIRSGENSRCSAMAKSTGKRCCLTFSARLDRLHGAGGGAPRGTAHPNFKHGMRTVEIKEMRHLVSLLRGNAG